jgi:hypothetical protein
MYTYCCPTFTTCHAVIHDYCCCGCPFFQPLNEEAYKKCTINSLENRFFLVLVVSNQYPPGVNPPVIYQAVMVLPFTSQYNLLPAKVYKNCATKSYTAASVLVVVSYTICWLTSGVDQSLMIYQ